ncbi:MAG: hypothetical protein Q8O56_10375 [Solirubrobacteraceae bacterium]|nr:hypothetical protein [Solirubrobacteraceae bacterium]
MSDDDEASDYDYEAAVVGMLTLRINTTPGEWLSDADLEIFGQFQREAIEADGEGWGNEYMFLAMMNTAWLALANLATVTGESQNTWLQRIAKELRFLPEQRGE